MCCENALSDNAIHLIDNINFAMAAYSVFGVYGEEAQRQPDTRHPTGYGPITRPRMVLNCRSYNDFKRAVEDTCTELQRDHLTKELKNCEVSSSESVTADKIRSDREYPNPIINPGGAGC